MAIAHVCLGCGWDLARVRAAPEPHYGLPLVICPRCQSTCVRQVHPLKRGWRRFVRLLCAIALLVLNLLILLLLLALTVWAATWLGYLLSTHSLRHGWTDEMIITAVLVGLLQLMVGAFLTFAMAHLNPFKVWIGWFLLSTLVLWVSLATWLLDRPTIDADALRAWLAAGKSSTLALATLTLIALAGVPAGWLLRAAANWHRTYRWRARRSRFRRFQAAA